LEIDTQDPLSKDENGAPSVFLYFRGNCYSDILSACFPSPDSRPIQGHPPAALVGAVKVVGDLSVFGYGFAKCK